ncbi:MAG: ABC transporter permease, partial [Acidobacteria bacterium]
AGETVYVDVREGRQPQLRAVVSRVIDDYLGLNAYMELSALRRLMQEGDTLSGAYLRVDPAMLERLNYQLKRTPAVAGVTRKDAAIESFNETFADMVGTMRVLYSIFAGLIALGVVYNSARISLAERARELGTLRVIGFSRNEVSFILLGELAVITAVAIPIGMLLGRLMVAALVEAAGSEAFRFPALVSTNTLLLAAGTIAGAAWLSAMGVRRKLHRLNLVESLKLRE